MTATPGGGNDFLARIIAPALGTVLGQQVIVDNRASRLVGGIELKADDVRMRALFKKIGLSPEKS